MLWALTQDGRNAMSKASSPRITGFEAVALEVSDFDRSVAFYRDILGLKVTVEAPGHFAMVPAINVYLLSTGRRKVRSTGFHLELAVNNVDDFYARLKAIGVKGISKPKEYPWGDYSFYLTDPDGHEIELSSPLP
jgi:lactoylglutathione lyase